MKKIIILLSSIILPFCLVSCFIGAGTHGSLKGYQYSIAKNKLDSAVMYVINNNRKIYRDTFGNKILAAVGNGKQDTIIDNSYNDGHAYVTIKIETEKGQCKYIFRYYGDEHYWDTSTISEIFICYAYNEFEEGGSEGNGGVDKKILKHLTEVFEKELTHNVDKRLNITHTEVK